MHARQDYGDIMDALRNGRIFVTTGDLVTSLDLTAGNRGREAATGETLTLRRRDRNDVDIEIRFRPLQGKNANGELSEIRRVDLIVGEITGQNANPDADTNRTTKVVARFGPDQWRRQGTEYVIRHTLRDVRTDLYARVRGTSTTEDEPLPDGLESPWSDLWFYSNPVFVHLT